MRESKKEIKGTSIDFKPKDYNNYNLSFPEVGMLLDQIELIKRRKIKDSKDKINYIDPFNHVKTLKNPVNHLIVGRRGAGKTSLLIKVIEEIEKSNGFVVVLDMQSKQRLSADLPLVEVLLKLFKGFQQRLESNQNWEPYIVRKSKIRYYKIQSYLFGLRNKKFWANEIIELDILYNSISSILCRLETIKQTPNGAHIKITKSNKESSIKTKETKIAGKISADYKYLESIGGLLP